MKYKIGVMGSSREPLDKIVVLKARALGAEIAKQDCILINGATTGLPNESAYGAKKAGGMVLGISPANNLQEHVRVYKLPTENYTTIVYTGFGFNLRNIVNIRTSDAVCFIKGSVGTLNEFTIAYEDGKIIGILEHSGGVSEFFDEIIDICNKKTKATIVYDSNPNRLVKKLIYLIKEKQKKR